MIAKHAIMLIFMPSLAKPYLLLANVKNTTYLSDEAPYAKPLTYMHPLEAWADLS